MDSYGVVPIWDHLLSVPGLAVYLLIIALGMVLVRSLTANIPSRYRSLNYMMYLFCVIAIATWWLQAMGWWFYVKA